MRKQYTEAFKLQVVRDIERGKTTMSEVARKYGINGAQTILRWLKRYGKGIVTDGRLVKSAKNCLAFLNPDKLAV